MESKQSSTWGAGTPSFSFDEETFKTMTNRAHKLLYLQRALKNAGKKRPALLAKFNATKKDMTREDFQEYQRLKQSLKKGGKKRPVTEKIELKEEVEIPLNKQRIETRTSETSLSAPSVAKKARVSSKRMTHGVYTYRPGDGGLMPFQRGNQIPQMLAIKQPVTDGNSRNNHLLFYQLAGPSAQAVAARNGLLPPSASNTNSSLTNTVERGAPITSQPSANAAAAAAAAAATSPAAFTSVERGSPIEPPAAASTTASLAPTSTGRASTMAPQPAIEQTSTPSFVERGPSIAGPSSTAAASRPLSKAEQSIENETFRYTDDDGIIKTILFKSVPLNKIPAQARFILNRFEIDQKTANKQIHFLKFIFKSMDIADANITTLINELAQKSNADSKLDYMKDQLIQLHRGQIARLPAGSGIEIFPLSSRFGAGLMRRKKPKTYLVHKNKVFRLEKTGFRVDTSSEDEAATEITQTRHLGFQQPTSFERWAVAVPPGYKSSAPPSNGNDFASSTSQVSALKESTPQKQKSDLLKEINSFKEQLRPTSSSIVYNDENIKSLAQILAEKRASLKSATERVLPDAAAEENADLLSVLKEKLQSRRKVVEDDEESAEEWDDATGGNYLIQKSIDDFLEKNPRVITFSVKETEKLKRNLAKIVEAVKSKQTSEQDQQKQVLDTLLEYFKKAQINFTKVVERGSSQRHIQDLNTFQVVKTAAEKSLQDDIKEIEKAIGILNERYWPVYYIPDPITGAKTHAEFDEWCKEIITQYVSAVNITNALDIITRSTVKYSSLGLAIGAIVFLLVFLLFGGRSSTTKSLKSSLEHGRTDLIRGTKTDPRFDGPLIRAESIFTETARRAGLTSITAGFEGLTDEQDALGKTVTEETRKSINQAKVGDVPHEMDGMVRLNQKQANKILSLNVSLPQRIRDDVTAISRVEWQELTPSRTVYQLFFLQLVDYLQGEKTLPQLSLSERADVAAQRALDQIASWVGSNTKKVARHTEVKTLFSNFLLDVNTEHNKELQKRETFVASMNLLFTAAKLIVTIVAPGASLVVEAASTVVTSATATSAVPATSTASTPVKKGWLSWIGEALKKLINSLPFVAPEAASVKAASTIMDHFRIPESAFVEVQEALKLYTTLELHDLENTQDFVNEFAKLCFIYLGGMFASAFIGLMQGRGEAKRGIASVQRWLSVPLAGRGLIGMVASTMLTALATTLDAPPSFAPESPQKVSLVKHITEAKPKEKATTSDAVAAVDTPLQSSTGISDQVMVSNAI